ncbi:methyl-accepting chemotaxis protein [[Clostridium] polysaccharolyticum]|uniref:Methyl-accepting chemotaxis protein (MCP) signalling domain-containing protein n=1 Tax=[Clostridium] polysaccharolyticum TaxID=29364 RepID=A0A1H9YWQ1_9FIRM|nr:methyl-accepting chemotaxis protein [[Clostridium] polysaccharolyticum]SES73578.1 Methyl-accepting chemotaxis protein (MCP) signalling domain-containing protein [[Clostridium] polysaccharolyticum]
MNEQSIQKIMENLDESQSKVEQNAFDAINSSDTTLNLVKQGNECIKELSEKIDILNSVMQKTAENMINMEKLTKKIEGVAGVIAGIANKTNMLALNASIEAARAGEQGRGFSVVANEVRELAGQSAKSSSEIKDTIQSVQQFTAQMVSEMDELKRLVNEQSQVNTSAGEIFDQILEAAHVANDVSRNMEHEIAYQREITDEVKKALQ